jgi:hypothetical protein
MRTLVLTTLAVRLLLSLVPFAAFGTFATHAQVTGAAPTTAEAEVIIVPPAPIQRAPNMTAEAFGRLISCQSGYQWGLDDDAVACCVDVQSTTAAAQ